MRRRVVVGIVTLLCLGASLPGAASAANKKLKPDLKITEIKLRMGTPPYAVVGTNGVAEPIEVYVVTRNQDAGRAGPSITDVAINDSKNERFDTRIHVPTLRGHGRFSATVEIKGARPALGLAHALANADFRNQVKESDETNNVAALNNKPLRILAKEWDPTQFDTLSQYGPFSISTFITGGFRFEFSRFDHNTGYFTYKASGSVENVATETGFCSGSSDQTRSHDPWEHSYLKIAPDLGGYQARIEPSSTENYTLVITCPGIGSHTEEHQFQPLDTFVGSGREPTMSPDQTELSDSHTDSNVHTTWKWTFTAKGV